MLTDRIAVVMITRNRAGGIRAALQHLADLPEKPRMIVVDNGSTDDTVNVARHFNPRVEVITLGRNLGAAGRNIGVQMARTPYVAFSDDDSWWAPGALALSVDRFDSFADLGLLAARVLVGPEQQLDPISRIMATSPLASDGHDGTNLVGVPIVSFVACGAIVRASAFLQAGGFNPHFGVGGEEEVLAMDMLRNGWHLAYAEDIVAYHYPSLVRNVPRRQRRQVRNALWSIWLRRPASSALASTWRIASSSITDGSCRLGMIDALTGLPWVLRERNPVPASVDRRVRIAESTFYSTR